LENSEDWLARSAAAIRLSQLSFSDQEQLVTSLRPNETVVSSMAARSAQSQSALSKLLTLLSALRPLHWLKNCFVLAPLLFSRAFHDHAALTSALWAFLAFCLAASAAYLWNDLHDQQVDRLHPSRRRRPLASGSLSPRVALLCILFLVGFVIALTSQLPAIAPHLVTYAVINVGYSLGLKRIPWLDIALLTAGFLLRVYAGAAAIDVDLSVWMATATFALALYLAAWKRHAELLNHGASTRPALAFYQASQLRMVALLAGAIGLACYILFVVFVRPLLWGTLIPVAVGMLRYGWLAAHYAEGASPFTTIARDPWLLSVTLLWAVGTLAALW
jgi:decaprenyl-phosphate phosphoribosyltransferase